MTCALALIEQRNSVWGTDLFAFGVGPWTELGSSKGSLSFGPAIPLPPRAPAEGALGAAAPDGGGAGEVKGGPDRGW